MPAKFTHPFVATLYRDRMALCSPTTSNPLELRFSDASIKDLEIVNPAELENQVQAFVAAHQIHPGELIFVFTNKVVFEKDLTKISGSERSDQIQAFLDSVPLSSVSHKIFRVQNVEKLIVINRNFYDGLKRSFEVLGFTVSAVIPSFMLGDIGAQDSTTAESCRLISKKIDFIRAHSFLSEENHSFHQKKRKFLQKNRIAVFVFALAAVGFAAATVFLTFRRPSRPSLLAISVTPGPTRVLTPTLQPTPAEASASASFSGSSLQILNGSGISGLAAQLQQKLTPFAFASVATGNTPTIQGKTQIVFSSRVSQPARQIIIDEVRLSFPEVAVREEPQAKYDIQITIGKIAP